MYKVKKETKRWLRAIEIAKVIFWHERYHTEYLEQIEKFIRREKMYSPRIKPELVQRLYKLAKAKKKPMTRIVNKIIEDYLEKNGGENKEGLAVSETEANKYK